MINIEAVFFDEITRGLSRLGSDIPFATAYTLTQMGRAGKDAARSEILRAFHNPTRWTRNSIFLDAATRSRQEARVWIKDGAVSSLAHHITGGRRPQKRFERRLRQAGIMRGPYRHAVAGYGAPLNKAGNVTMAQINKVLSAMGAQGDKHANSSDRSVKRNGAQGDYFAFQAQGGMPPGIYKRVGSRSNPQLRSIFIFVKSVRYKRRFHFYEVVEDAAYDAMPKAIDKAIDQSLARSMGR